VRAPEQANHFSVDLNDLSETQIPVHLERRRSNSGCSRVNWSSALLNVIGDCDFFKWAMNSITALCSSDDSEEISWTSSCGCMTTDLHLIMSCRMACFLEATARITRYPVFESDWGSVPTLYWCRGHIATTVRTRCKPRVCGSGTATRVVQNRGLLLENWNERFPP
jgi:hypothetical protein